ncbi:MAG TPA: hypothetical protein VGH05_06235 [Buttiauxella sp.]|jgi:hypothetical protein
MSGIFSCFTRQSPVDTLQAFQNSVEKAADKGRISTSNLDKLLKTVQNSPEQMTINQYRQIQDKVQILDSVLIKQDSAKYEQKNAKITEAYNLVSQKLTPEAKIARAWEAKQGYTDEIKRALDTVKTNMPQLKLSVVEARERVNSTVANLPTKESQQKARELISSQHYSAFGKDAAITDSLFPSQTKQVERRNGFREQKFDHPDKSKWTSLESKSRQLAEVKLELNAAKTLLNHADNFSFNKPDSTGKLELTAHQKELLKFARQITS